MTDPRDPDATTTPGPILSEFDLGAIWSGFSGTVSSGDWVRRSVKALLESHRALTEKLAEAELETKVARDHESHEWDEIEYYLKCSREREAALAAQLAAKDATIAEQHATMERAIQGFAAYRLDLAAERSRRVACEGREAELRKALEFYADATIYMIDRFTKADISSHAIRDTGAKARAALTTSGSDRAAKVLAAAEKWSDHQDALDAGTALRTESDGEEELRDAVRAWREGSDAS